MSKFTAPSPVLKCSWMQLKENGHIRSISLNEVGEEEAGLLMTLNSALLWVSVLLPWREPGRPHRQMKAKIKG